jgi:medium-chain acyl-[acyl-carrier-protein] hydrolase
MIVSGSKISDEPADGSNRLWFESLASPQRHSLRLFCFPYAGGNAQAFRNWQRHFPSQIGLCLVNLPGRGKRIGEPPFQRLQPMVQEIADAISPELELPFAFYGHSMGALIAFELARELRRRLGPTPAQLFLSGRRSPRMPSFEAARYDLPEEEFVAHVMKLNGTPKELFDIAETRTLFLPILRADFEAVHTYEYVPGQRLSCPLTVYGGIEDTHAPFEALQAWQEETSDNCEVRMLPGDHFFIHRPDASFIHTLRRDVVSVLHTEQYNRRAVLQSTPSGGTTPTEQSNKRA